MSKKDITEDSQENEKNEIESEIPEKKKGGILYIVSTPIGHKSDITLRALRVLESCDLVVCEEFRVGAALLKKYNINRPLDNLNEQNESHKYPEIIDLIKEGKKIALVSDCGTPIFADPGKKLLDAALRHKLEIKVIPGVTSIMAALVRSGFDIESFYFAGFMSRTSSERLEEFEDLSHRNETICLLETPYRLLPLLKDASEIMPDRQAYIAFNLTTDQETHHYGTFKELYDKFEGKRIREEFVVCFAGSQFRKKSFKENPEKFRSKSHSYDDREKSFGGRGRSDGDRRSSFGGRGRTDGDRRKSYGDRGKSSGDRRKSFGGSRDGGSSRDRFSRSDDRRPRRDYDRGEAPKRRDSDEKKQYKKKDRWILK